VRLGLLRAQRESADEVIRCRVPARSAPAPAGCCLDRGPSGHDMADGRDAVSVLISLYEIYFKLSTTVASRFNLGPAAEGHPGEML
jgi:hypothetical protein